MGTANSHIVIIEDKCIDYDFHCVGQISHPSDGNTFVVLPGQNVTLAWKIHINISDVQVRSWRFLPKGNSFADIVLDQEVIEKVQYAPGPFIIKKPSTLILKNINIQYNGTYRLGIFVHGVSFYTSYVHVFVAGKYLLKSLVVTFHLLKDFANLFITTLMHFIL